MAERRMFAKSIIDSDLFLDMPATTQMLYFHLAMRADDDGFINNPKRIMRMIGSSDDDMRILISKQFVINFDSGVIVIRHWKMHNYIQKDRYKPTICEEKKQLKFEKNLVYQLSTDGIPDDNHTDDSLGTSCIQSVSSVDTQYRLGKDRDRLDKVRLGEDNIYGDENVPEPKKKPTKKFKKPTLEEVKAYCSERKNNVDAEKFIDYYESNGWHVGKNPMKDWKAAVRTWERNNYGGYKNGTGYENTPDYSNEEGLI